MKRLPMLLTLQAAALFFLPLIASYFVTARDLDLERHWKSSISHLYTQAPVVAESSIHAAADKAEVMRILDDMIAHQRAKDRVMELMILITTVAALVLLCEAYYINRRTKNEN